MCALTCVVVHVAVCVKLCVVCVMHESEKFFTIFHFHEFRKELINLRILSPE